MLTLGLYNMYVVSVLTHAEWAFNWRGKEPSICSRCNAVGSRVVSAQINNSGALGKVRGSGRCARSTIPLRRSSSQATASATPSPSSGDPSA